MKAILTFAQFIFLGLVTAAIGEWQFSVFLRNDFQNFLGSLFFNTLYLSAAYLVTRLFLNTLRRHDAVIFLYTVLFALCGLMVEWFLIGNSPWGNPDASQLGMAAYWACMVLVPLVFLLDKPSIKSFILSYGIVYTVLILIGQLAIPSPEWRFAFHIYAVILGYLGLVLGILWGVIQPQAGFSRIVTK